MYKIINYINLALKSNWLNLSTNLIIMIFKHRKWEFSEPVQISRFEFQSLKYLSDNNTLNLKPRIENVHSVFEFQFKLFKWTAIIFMVFYVLEKFISIKKNSILDTLSMVILLPLILLSFGALIKFLPEYASYSSYKSKSENYYNKLEKAIRDSNTYDEFYSKFYAKWYEKLFK